MEIAQLTNGMLLVNTKNSFIDVKGNQRKHVKPLHWRLG
jgi:hypothetical protein